MDVAVHLLGERTSDGPILGGITEAERSSASTQDLEQARNDCVHVSTSHGYPVGASVWKDLLHYGSVFTVDFHSLPVEVQQSTKPRFRRPD